MLADGHTKSLVVVPKIISYSKQYKALDKELNSLKATSFTYNGVVFSQDTFHLFPGLCAVDNAQNVELVFRALQRNNIFCARMGVYKPRTSPYSFQGLGKICLPYVFELAGLYGIKVLAMEVTHERQLDEIRETLAILNNPTGVLVQIGTRNAQNFELLRSIGSQSDFPILYKRGFGITLQESLDATEYLAMGGNEKIIFCLRGMKSLFGAPHRNLTDFAHISVIKRLTRMPVCVDPSHAVGSLETSSDGINDIFHAAAQGIIAGANMLLIDFHPTPETAVVDAEQAIPLKNLEWFLDDITITREAYEKRRTLEEKQRMKLYECEFI